MSVFGTLQSIGTGLSSLIGGNGSAGLEAAQLYAERQSNATQASNLRFTADEQAKNAAVDQTQTKIADAAHQADSARSVAVQIQQASQQLAQTEEKSIGIT